MTGPGKSIHWLPPSKSDRDACGREPCAARGRGGEALQPLDLLGNAANQAVGAGREVRAADEEARRDVPAEHVRGARAARSRWPRARDGALRAWRRRRARGRRPGSSAWSKMRSNATVRAPSRTQPVDDPRVDVAVEGKAAVHADRGRVDARRSRRRATACARRGSGSGRRRSRAPATARRCRARRRSRRARPDRPSRASPPRGRSVLDGDQSPRDRPLRELGALLVLRQPRHAEELVHRAQVRLHRVEAEEELLADLLVATPARRGAARRRRAGRARPGPCAASR